jgi:hypothetical protein
MYSRSCREIRHASQGDLFQRVVDLLARALLEVGRRMVEPVGETGEIRCPPLQFRTSCDAATALVGVTEIMLGS